MTSTQLDQNDLEPELQLEFHGCIVPLTSDKSKKPAKLTEEQSREVAELLYMCFKRWYGL